VRNDTAARHILFVGASDPLSGNGCVYQGLLSSLSLSLSGVQLEGGRCRGKKELEIRIRSAHMPALWGWQSVHLPPRNPVTRGDRALTMQRQNRTQCFSLVARRLIVQTFQTCTHGYRKRNKMTRYEHVLKVVKNRKSDGSYRAQACTHLFSYADKHSFLCAINQTIELLRQTICSLALRKDESMPLHYPCNSSSANNSERPSRAKRQSVKSTLPFPRRGAWRCECSRGAPRAEEQIVRLTRGTIQTGIQQPWDLLPVTIPVDRTCARSADNVKFVKRKAG